MKTVLCAFLLLVAVSVARDVNETLSKRDVLTCNAITTCGSNKFIYSSSSSLVEATYVTTTSGSNIKVGDPSVATSTTFATKLLLQGVDQSATSGPQMTFYTSVDTYPIMELMAWTRNGNG